MFETVLLVVGCVVLVVLLVVVGLFAAAAREDERRRRSLADAVAARYAREVREDAEAMGEIQRRGDLG